MAGPVVAAAVIFAPETFISGVHDSKQLTPEQREELFVRSASAPSRSASASPRSTRSIGSTSTGRRCPRAPRAVGSQSDARPRAGRRPRDSAPQTSADPNRGRRPQEFLHRGGLNHRQGDARPDDGSLDDRYPGYGFAQHKGYCTTDHMQMLISSAPRRSIAGHSGR